MRSSVFLLGLDVGNRSLQGNPPSIRLNKGDQPGVDKAKEEEHQKWNAEIDPVMEGIVDRQAKISGEGQFNQRQGAFADTILLVLPVVGVLLNPIFRSPLKVGLISQKCLQDRLRIIYGQTDSKGHQQRNI